MATKLSGVDTVTFIAVTSPPTAQKAARKLVLRLFTDIFGLSFTSAQVRSSCPFEEAAWQSRTIQPSKPRGKRTSNHPDT